MNCDEIGGRDNQLVHEGDAQSSIFCLLDPELSWRRQGQKTRLAAFFATLNGQLQTGRILVGAGGTVAR